MGATSSVTCAAEPVSYIELAAGVAVATPSHLPGCDWPVVWRALRRQVRRAGSRVYSLLSGHLTRLVARDGGRVRLLLQLDVVGMLPPAYLPLPAGQGHEA